MSSRFIAIIFMVSLILFLVPRNARTEDTITPNQDDVPTVSVSQIEPSPVAEGVCEVDDIAIFRLEGTGCYEVRYCVDEMTISVFTVWLPYDFKTTFRGLEEGEHSVTFTVEDASRNVIDKHFIANVKH